MLSLFDQLLYQASLLSPSVLRLLLLLLLLLAAAAAVEVPWDSDGGWQKKQWLTAPRGASGGSLVSPPPAGVLRNWHRWDGVASAVLAAAAAGGMRGRVLMQEMAAGTRAGMRGREIEGAPCHD